MKLNLLFYFFSHEILPVKKQRRLNAFNRPPFECSPLFLLSHLFEQKRLIHSNTAIFEKAALQPPLTPIPRPPAFAKRKGGRGGGGGGGSDYVIYNKYIKIYSTNWMKQLKGQTASLWIHILLLSSRNFRIFFVNSCSKKMHKIDM